MTPRWRSAPVAIAGLVACTLLFAALGVWQQRRAAESRALAARFDAGTAEPAATLPPAALGGERYRRFALRGRYRADRQLLLDNRVVDARAGYEVLTPFEPEGGGTLVIVNRGWVAADGDRRVLPDVAVADDPRSIAGRLDVLPRPGMRLAGGDAGGQGGVAVVSYPTAAEIAARVGQPVYDYQLLLEAGEPDGFRREWRAAGLVPERHLAYAWQWWALSACAFVATIAMARQTRGKGRAT